MQNYKIVFSYDGTDFCGWQTQPNGVSIQTTLINTFKHAFKHEAVIIASSRTDSGVHANGAVALVRSTLDLPVSEVLKTWNRVLPKSILIKSLKRVSSTF
jgi:tRNA pseudouridine38-40 synthase